MTVKQIVFRSVLAATVTATSVAISATPTINSQLETNAINANSNRISMLKEYGDVLKDFRNTLCISEPESFVNRILIITSLSNFYLATSHPDFKEVQTESYKVFLNSVISILKGIGITPTDNFTSPESAFSVDFIQGLSKEELLKLSTAERMNLLAKKNFSNEVKDQLTEIKNANFCVALNNELQKEIDQSLPKNPIK